MTKYIVSVTPEEAEKQIEELRKENAILKDKFENLEKLLQRALLLIEQLEKACKEEKAQN